MGWAERQPENAFSVSGCLCLFGQPENGLCCQFFQFRHQTRAVVFSQLALRVDFGFVVAGGVAHAVGVHRALVIQIAQRGGGGKLRQVVFHRMPERAVFLIRGGRRAGGE